MHCFNAATQWGKKCPKSLLICDYLPNLKDTGELWGENEIQCPLWCPSIGENKSHLGFSNRFTINTL